MFIIFLVVVYCFSLIGTPGQPLGGCMRHFNMIEANMKLRYIDRGLHAGWTQNLHCPNVIIIRLITL